MKHKASELTGTLLDLAVGMALGHNIISDPLGIPRKKNCNIL